MKRFTLLLAAAALLSAFGLNYNASKSNTGNIVVHPSNVSEAQASAVLASLDASRDTPTEAAVRGHIAKAGIKPGAIKRIIIERNAQGKSNVLLLADPGDEAPARTSLSRSRSNTSHN